MFIGMFAGMRHPHLWTWLMVSLGFTMALIAMIVMISLIVREQKDIDEKKKPDRLSKRLTPSGLNTFAVRLNEKFFRGSAP